MRLALALCLLWQALSPRPGGGEHPTADRASCLASGACYSLHHATIQRLAAEEACNLRGGELSPVRGGPELHAVLALVRAGPGPGGGSKDLLFWVALERKKSHCTQGNEPLRGFSWLSPDGEGSENETLQWVEEPQLSCTARRCAGLQATGGVEPAGWKEMRCQLRADGYLCKYQFEGLCPAPGPGAAWSVSYRAPFQLHSAALDFSPPGTEVSALCPGQLSVSVSCTVDKGATRWDGLSSGGVLCPCAGGYLLAGKCAELPGCLDDLGRFICECGTGFELSKDGQSCVTVGEGQLAPGEETKEATRWPQVPAASSMPRRTGSPMGHGKPGERPLVSGEGGSATSTPEIPQWGARSTMSTTPSGNMTLRFNSTPSSAAPQTFDSSSTVVFILVSIAVVVLVILTVTVLGLFKLCFHKNPPSSPRKGPLATPGAENDAEDVALPSDSAHSSENGVKIQNSGLQDKAEGDAMVGSSLGSGEL